MDAQDIQDLVLGVWCLVILGIRKPAPDHRPSQLLAQEPLVLFILSIDVHNGKNIDPRAPGRFPPHRISLRLAATPPQGRTIPRSDFTVDRR